MDSETPPANLKEAIDRLRAMRDEAIKQTIAASINGRITPQWMFVKTSLINKSFKEHRDMMVEMYTREG